MKPRPWWETLLFVAFLFWCGAGLYFSWNHLTASDVARWPLSPSLIDFVQGCLRTGDPVLILLAFANTHAHAARQWTPAVARRWALVLLVGSFVIETIGVSTGLLFGVYHYTNNFGPLLGLVPLTIPLAWHIVVTNAVFVVRLLFPAIWRSGEALLAALICTFYDFILEPFATGAKHYWAWEGGVIPARNYACWFLLSGAFVWFFAPRLSTRHRVDARPFAILGLTLLIFVVGR